MPRLLAPIEGKILFLFFEKKEKDWNEKREPIFEQCENLVAPKKNFKKNPFIANNFLQRIAFHHSGQDVPRNDLC